MWWLRIVTALILLPACSPTGPEETVDWNRIDYKQIACGKNPAIPGCKASASDDAALAGRSKGR